MTDLEAIKARIPKYGGGDLRALVAEVEALRAQVQELQALGVSLHKAADAGAQAERAAVVAYLRELGAINSMLSPMKGAADDIERGDHRQGKS